MKLFDFGLAVMHEDEALTAAGDIPGTLAYISPERLRGEPARPAADVWAVGVLLWEALAGQHPFWGGSLLDTARRIEEGAPSLASMRPDLDPAIVECVDRALAVDPKRRPSARMLAARLRKVAPGLRRAGRRPPRPSMPPAAAARKVVPAGAAVLFAAWSASALPFFPAGWPLARCPGRGCSRYSTTASGWPSRSPCRCSRSGTTRWGLALVYGAAALAWLIFSWRDAEAGLFMTSGPLLASIGLVGCAPRWLGLAHRKPGAARHPGGHGRPRHRRSCGRERARPPRHCSLGPSGRGRSGRRAGTGTSHDRPGRRAGARGSRRSRSPAPAGRGRQQGLRRSSSPPNC